MRAYRKTENILKLPVKTQNADSAPSNRTKM